MYRQDIRKRLTSSFLGDDTDRHKKFQELIQTFDMVISAPLTFHVCGAGRQSL